MRLAAFDARIARAEADYLRQNGTRRWWHYLLLIGSVLIGLPYVAPRLLPTMFPQGFPHQSSYSLGQPTLMPNLILFMMFLGCYLFGFFLLTQAALVGLQSINREISSGNWQALRLTQISESQIIGGKWWGAVRFFWRDFTLATIPPVLLTYFVFISDYLHLFDIDRAESLCRPLWGLFRAYCGRQIFILVNFGPNGVYVHLLDNLAISLLISVILALGMLGFTVAVGQLAALISRREMLVQAGLLAMMRLIVAIVLITSMIGLALWKEYSPIRGASDSAVFCENGQRYDWLDCAAAPFQRQVLRATETLEVALMPLIDGGVMLRVNLMQPIATKMFLLRTLISGGMALSLYALLTWGALRLSTWLSRRQVLVGS